MGRLEARFTVEQMEDGLYLLIYVSVRQAIFNTLDLGVMSPKMVVISMK